MCNFFYIIIIYNFLSTPNSCPKKYKLLTEIKNKRYFIKNRARIRGNLKYIENLIQNIHQKMIYYQVINPKKVYLLIQVIKNKVSKELLKYLYK